MTDIDQTAPDPSEYVLVRRDLIQRTVDEAIDGGRHYAIERDLRAALDPPIDKDAD